MFSIGERDDRLIWILGSSRSGSTWLLRMLGELPGAVIVDDPHLGHHLGVWRPIPLAWAGTGEPPDLSTLTEIKRHKPDYFFSERYRDDWLPALRDLVVARFDAQARDLAAGRGIDTPLVIVKEPGSQAADLITSMFPGSGLIFLLRDGRDVVDSWLDAYRPGSWALAEGAYPVPDEQRIAFIRWQSSVWLYRTEAVQRAYARHDPSRSVLVRYEELRREPAAGLERMCRRFGIPASREELDRIAARHLFANAPRAERGEGRTVAIRFTPSDAWRTDLFRHAGGAKRICTGRTMRFAEPGRWRRNLSEREEAAMLEVIGDKLEELGYLHSKVGLAA